MFAVCLVLAAGGQFQWVRDCKSKLNLNLMEEAILNLTKLVGTFVEAQKTINAQLSQKIDIVKNNVNKRIDGFQSEMEHKFDNMQYSISRLTIQQHVHQEEVNPEEECLIDTTVEEKCKQQKEETYPMLTEEGNGKEEMEEPEKSTAKATNSPLPEAPTIKATPSMSTL